MVEQREENINPRYMMMILLGGAMITMLNQTILSTALPAIMKDLDITASTGQWLTTVYMLVSAIMVPLSALLLEKYPTKKLFLTSMLIYGLGTILCIFSTNFYAILLGRMVQGVGGGVVVPMLYTIIFIIYPLEKRGSIMGLVGLVIGVAPAIGPVLSGWIVDQWHWKVTFILLLPFIFLVITMGFVHIRNVVPLKKWKVDVPSIIFSSLGFGLFLYGFSVAGNVGWNQLEVIASTGIGGISIFAFIRRQLKLETPMLEVRVFQSKVFTLTTIMGTIVNLAIISATLILPIYIQSVRNEAATMSGFMLLPGALLMSFFSPISGKFYDKYGVKSISFLGMGILCISTIPFLMLKDDTSLIWITILYGIRMIGISFVIMPLQTAGINALPANLVTHGSAVLNTFRQVWMSIGTAFLITIMNNVTVYYKPDAGLESVNPGTYKQLGLEASLKGINATFLVTLILCLVAFSMIMFLKEKKKPIAYEMDVVNKA